MKATWKDKTIAESDVTVVIENNHYFPPDSVNMEYLKPSENVYHCSWKGDANYYDVVVGEDKIEDGGWVYKTPEDAAKEIAGYFAFWKGVEITE